MSTCCKSHTDFGLTYLYSPAFAQLSMDIQNLYAELIRISDAQSKSQAKSQESIEAISHGIDSIGYHCRNAENSAMVLSNLVRSSSADSMQKGQQERIQKEFSRSEKPYSILQPAQQEKFIVVEKKSNWKPLVFDQASLAASASWQQGGNVKCCSECKCSCHIQRHTQALSSILGRFFLAYGGGWFFHFSKFL